MMFELAKWSIAVLSLAGVILNIRRRRECFIVWAGTNAAWTGIDLYHGIYAQATLQAIYFGLAIYGLIEWSKKVAD